jgi:hypothetical protein
MRLTLPRAWAQIMFAAACSHPQAPVPPGPPISAEPEISVGEMDAECGGLDAALEAYGQCPNLDDGERSWIRATKEFAEQTFAAGKKAQPEAQALHAMAVACHKAAASIHAATARCQAGPRPRVDY